MMRSGGAPQPPSPSYRQQCCCEHPAGCAQLSLMHPPVIQGCKAKGGVRPLVLQHSRHTHIGVHLHMGACSLGSMNQPTSD